MNFKETKLNIDYNQINLEGGETVMHEWEKPLMKKAAEYVCQNGGNILEIGFGMGIASNFIQEQNIKSHTICEVHPQIISRAKKWAYGKENVRILEGFWYENLMLWRDGVDQSKTYDGILYDAHRDPHHYKVKEMVNTLAEDGCLVTWWNNSPKEWNEMKLPNVEFETINVNPPVNNYFNHKKYFMPKYVHKTKR